MFSQISLYTPTTNQTFYTLSLTITSPTQLDVTKIDISDLESQLKDELQMVMQQLNTRFKLDYLSPNFKLPLITASNMATNNIQVYDSIKIKDILAFIDHLVLPEATQLSSTPNLLDNVLELLHADQRKLTINHQLFNQLLIDTVLYVLLNQPELKIKIKKN